MGKNKKEKARTLAGIATVFSVTLIVYMYMKQHGLGLEWLLGLGGRNYLVFMLISLTVFAVKGIVMFIPLTGLYLAVGLLSGNIPIGICINIIGAIICISIAFFNGRKLGKDKYQEILSEYPKLKEIEDANNSNRYILTVLVRAIGILPCDMVSMFFGAKGIRYTDYLLGSMTGMLPGLLLTSLLGYSIKDPSSPRFIISIIFRSLMSIVSFAIYTAYLKKARKNNVEADRSR